MDLFLSKTKVSFSSMEKIARMLQFESSHIVEARNGVEGMAIFSKDECSLDIIFRSNWIIGVKVTSQ